MLRVIWCACLIVVAIVSLVGVPFAPAAAMLCTHDIDDIGTAYYMYPGESSADDFYTSEPTPIDLADAMLMLVAALVPALICAGSVVYLRRFSKPGALTSAQKDQVFLLVACMLFGPIIVTVLLRRL